MTIKARSRHTFILFLLSVITFFVFLALIIFQAINNNLVFPEVYFTKTPRNNLVFGYNPYVILGGIFWELIYVITTTFLVWRGFYKTQSSIIIFLLIFVLALYIDSFRILIPIFQVSNAYTHFLLFIGNMSLFARILAPLSLLITGILHFDEQTPNINRYILVLIFGTLLLTSIIPLNTSKILPVFCVSYGYIRAIEIGSIAIVLLSSISIFINNIVTETKQYTALGFFLTCCSTIFVFYTYNLFFTVLTYIFFAIGTTMYLTQLHKEYLWK